MWGADKIWILRTLIVATFLVWNSVALAVEVKFDFDDDDLPYFSGTAEIEDYMEKIYGSDITVIGGRVGNGIIAGPLGDDHYIQAGPKCGTYWLSFSFNEVPITGVSFDWAVELNTFHAFADDIEFFSEGWGCWSFGNSGTIYFESPVTTLKFTDSNLWEIEVDNLIVTPFPEPASIFLLGMGFVLMTHTQKGKFS